MHLLDINFWLALTFQSHAHHPSAAAWMQSAQPASCCFCRVTQMGFLRLSTNRKAFPHDALTMEQAWRVYDRLLGDDRVAFAEEPRGMEMSWRALTQTRSFSTHVWTDAYLAAFAQAANFEIVTFDKDFANFGNLRHVILS